MKKVVVVMMVALMTTVSVSAQLKKRFDTANFNRGIELVDEGKLDEGLKCFEDELKEHPKNPYAHFYMATVYMDKKQYDYAMTAIDKALKYMPKRNKELRGISHALKACLHESFKEWDEAIEQLTLCLKVLPDDETSLRDRTVAYKQRATMYYKLGRYDLGDKDYEKYKELKKETEFDY